MVSGGRSNPPNTAAGGGRWIRNGANRRTGAPGTSHISCWSLTAAVALFSSSADTF